MVTNKKKRQKKNHSDSTSSSMISTVELQSIVERLRCERCRSSTRKNYHTIWKQFGKFFQRLDHKPITWEESITLFVGHLINCNLQSSTIRSYLSAIRCVLAEDKIELEQNSFVLTSLIRASRIKNDVLPVRLPIHKYLLRLIQKELVKYCEERNQCYLQLLYLALFSTAYYGLLRIGEVTYSQHVLLAKDVHVGTNKNKMLLVLHTSKTHGKGENHR